MLAQAAALAVCCCCSLVGTYVMKLLASADCVCGHVRWCKASERAQVIFNLLLNSILKQVALAWVPALLFAPVNHTLILFGRAGDNAPAQLRLKGARE